MCICKFYLPVNIMLALLLVNPSITLTEQVFCGHCPPHHDKSITLQSSIHDNMLFPASSLDDSHPGFHCSCACSLLHAGTDSLPMCLNSKFHSKWSATFSIIFLPMSVR